MSEAPERVTRRHGPDEGADASARAAGQGRRRAPRGNGDVDEALAGLTVPPVRRMLGRRGPLVLGACLLVLVLGVGAYLIFGGAEEAPVARLPSTVRVYPSEAELLPLADRTRDKRALSAGEVFGEDLARRSFGGVTLTATGARRDQPCSAAVWGQRVVEALRTAKCTEVVRAGYRGDKHVGVVAVFNLGDAHLATRLAEAMKLRAGFVRPPVTGDPFDKLGTAYSRADASVEGHYLVIVWVARTDGGKPTDLNNDDLINAKVALGTVDRFVYRRLVEIGGDGPTGNRPGTRQPGAGQPGAGQPGTGTGG